MLAYYILLYANKMKRVELRVNKNVSSFSLCSFVCPFKQIILASLGVSFHTCKMRGKNPIFLSVLVDVIFEKNLLIKMPV